MPDDTDNSAFDLTPVNYTPQFADAPIPKQGQSIQPVNVGQDIGPQGSMASAVGSLTGISDAAKAWRGEFTPEEAQMFALGALPALAGGPEAKVAEEALPAAANSVRQGIRAFHGSPYDFDKFDLSKIGTGEGAQAYGHGLYFAENKATAKTYRDSLSDAKYSTKSRELTPNFRRG